VQAIHGSSKCAALWLVALGLLVMLGAAGCRTEQPADSTTTEYRLTLLPVPPETPASPMDYQWGYIDRAGKWVIQPRFEAAWSFVEGLATVKLDGKRGYIDETGSTVIEPQFTEAYNFSGGLARVATGPPPLPGSGRHFETASDYGFIDKTGRMVIPATWDAAGGFSEGLAAVMRDSACGFIDTTGELAIPLKFDVVGPFSEGLAQASVDGKCGYIDKTGNWIISPQYEGSLLPSGVLPYGMWWAMGGRFTSGLAPVYVDAGPAQGGGTCQYIDQTGKKAFGQVFQYGGEFSEGLAPVCVDDKWGFIDTSGRMVIEPQYGPPSGEPFFYFYLEPDHGFHSGLAPVAIDGKLGYIDHSGTFVIAPQYLNGTGFVGGFAYVYQDAVRMLTGVIDVTGRLVYVVPPRADTNSTTSP
jgi:hypothetical protein